MTKNGLFVLSSIAAVLLSPVATAQSIDYRLGAPTVLKIGEPRGGPKEEEGGAGNEQNDIAFASDPATGKLYILSVRITSDVSEADRPWQCQFASIELDPLTGPRVVANVQITDNNEGNNDSERPCGHPRIATDGTINHMIVGWGEENNNGNVQPYVAGIDILGNRGARTRVNNDENANDGALGLVYLTQPSATNLLGREGKVVNGNLHVGYIYNNNGDRARGGLLQVTGTGAQTEVTVVTNRNLIDPTNITRGRIVQINTAPAGSPPNDRFLAFSAKGDNRPPEDGAYAQLIDAVSGDRIWDNGGKVVLASEPDGNPRRYVNMPEGVTQFLGPTSQSPWNSDLGRVAVFSEVSRGNNGGNTRGRTKAAITFIQVTDTDLIVMNNQEDIGAQQVHSTLCASNYGAMNNENVPSNHLIIAEATITRSGPPTFTPVTYLADAALGGGPLLSELRTLVANDALNGFYADSGYLSNIYGQNPNNQGRDFLHCAGDLPNPGANIEGGYRPEVQSFFVMTYNGGDPEKENLEPKNAAYVALIPSVTTRPDVPPPPVYQNLSVNLSGDGRGAVLSTPTGIDCGSTCTFDFDSTNVVVLRATPEEGSVFVGWQGDFVGNADAVMSMSAPHTLTAVFAKTQLPVGGNPDQDPAKPPAQKGDRPADDPAGPSCDTDLTACGQQPEQPIEEPTTIGTTVSCGCSTTEQTSGLAGLGLFLLLGLVGFIFRSRR